MIWIALAPIVFILSLMASYRLGVAVGCRIGYVAGYAKGYEWLSTPEAEAEMIKRLKECAARMGVVVTTEKPHERELNEIERNKTDK